MPNLNIQLQLCVAFLYCEKKVENKDLEPADKGDGLQALPALKTPIMGAKYLATKNNEAKVLHKIQRMAMAPESDMSILNAPVAIVATQGPKHNLLNCF